MPFHNEAHPDIFLTSFDFMINTIYFFPFSWSKEAKPTSSTPKLATTTHYYFVRSLWLLQRQSQEELCWSCTPFFPNPLSTWLPWFHQEELKSWMHIQLKMNATLCVIAYPILSGFAIIWHKCLFRPPPWISENQWAEWARRAYGNGQLD